MKIDDKTEPVCISSKESGLGLTEAQNVLIWGHGWGQTNESFAPLASILDAYAKNILLDLPGFGKSDTPPKSWGTAEYADAIAAELARRLPDRPIVWVGHSFGGRVGIQLAARHPRLLRALILIASAGLPRKRSLLARVWLWTKVRLFKLGVLFASLVGVDPSVLRTRFGSADYRQAGAMRDVMLNVIREDLSQAATSIKCPVLLVYGATDQETPPEIGERLAKLIPNARLSVLPTHNHYSLLEGGRHLVATRMVNFLGQL